jgi:hypothetical protein
VAWQPTRSGTAAQMSVFGGSTTHGATAGVWSLDIREWTWRKLETTGAAPSNRESHAAAMVGHRMVVHGGSGGGGGGDTLEDAFALDVSTLRWSATETARAWLAAGEVSPRRPCACFR